MNARGIQIILDRFYASLASGVQRFERPLASEQLENPGSDAGAVRQSLLDKVAFLKGKLSELCPGPIFFSQECVAKPFLILADFPEPADEEQLKSSAALFSSANAASTLLLRLFTRLGVHDHMHSSFALKVLPKKGFTHEIFQICRDILTCEIGLTSPEYIICFGQRAAKQLEDALDVKLEVFGESPPAGWQTLSLRCFVFPSARELAAFPEWRAAVWENLQSLVSQSR